MVLQPLLGLTLLLVLAWTLSEDRARTPWRTVIVGIGLQITLAVLLLKLPASREVFHAIGAGVLALQEATKAGTSLVFGFVGGGVLPFKEPYPGAAFVLAFQALPLILVVSALTALLYYWRVLPVVVRLFARGLEKSLGISGAGGVAAAANVFVGMIEAPLFIKPYMAKLSRSEMFLVMTTGMATIAGTVLVLYASFLSGVIPDPAGHLVTASLINAPAAIVVAKLLIPGDDALGQELEMPKSEATSSIDAITRGTFDGVQILINVIAMLVVLVALISLANMILGLLPDVAGEPLKLERVLGWIMAPVTWLIGIPWAEAQTAGGLMGVKTVLNELIAYFQFSQLPADALSERSKIIMTYAMCGFANFGSLGIMIGGLASVVPEKRQEIVGLGMKSILSGTLATLMTGAVVGIVY